MRGRGVTPVVGGTLPRVAVLFLVALLAALLAACGTSAPRGGSRRAPERPGGAACVVALSYENVAFDRVADTARKGGCGIATAVRVLGAPTAFNRPVLIDCTLADALARWETTVVQPAALAAFGQRVTRVHHYGGYVCRNRRSGSRLSEHAYGKAIDIAAFTLTDGTLVSVEKDWRAGGPRQAFLHQVTAGACGTFSVVLSPNSDADHYNHLHLDVGPWTLCSP